MNWLDKALGFVYGVTQKHSQRIEQLVDFSLPYSSSFCHMPATSHTIGIHGNYIIALAADELLGNKDPIFMQIF